MESLLSNAIQVASRETNEHRELNKLSVLVADDEDRVVNILTISLKSLGHEVIAVADNGEDAVTLAREKNPDLIILDIDMPRLDGINAAKQILAESSVPVVISSGRTDPETLQRARKLNIQAYLVKPFSRAQLSSAIIMAVAQHQNLLTAKMKIAELTDEIRVVKSVDLAVELLMEKFRIDRKEALEKLEMAALARPCSLVDAATAISATLSSHEPVLV